MPRPNGLLLVRRVAVGVLAGVGLWLVARGLSETLNDRAAARVAAAFLDAVLTGDRTRALQYFDPDSPAAQRLRSQNVVWAPSPGFSYRLLELHVEDGRATARFRVKQLGYVAEPVLRLRRGPDGWKVTAVENYRFRHVPLSRSASPPPDPNEQLAEELQSALATVEKSPETDGEASR